MTPAALNRTCAQAGLAWLLLAAATAFTGMESGQASDGLAPEPPKLLLGKIRAELSLDETEGRLTYAVRNVSNGPVTVHARTLKYAEAAFCIEPDAESAAIADEDYVDVEEGFVYEVDDGLGWGSNRKAPPDRVIDLMPGESLSRSMILQDLPWFERLVAQLKKRKFKQYRLDPSVIFFTADAHGKPVMDHTVEVWKFEPDKEGNLRKVHFTGGIMMTVPQAMKLKALARQKAPDSVTKD